MGPVDAIGSKGDFLARLFFLIIFLDTAALAAGKSCGMRVVNLAGICLCGHFSVSSINMIRVDKSYEKYE
jgi:hypothetical protein